MPGDNNILSDCQNLRQCEERLKKWIRPGELLGRIPLGPEDCLWLGNETKKIMDQQWPRERTKLLWRNFPAGMAVLLVNTGIYHYQAGEFWPFVEENAAVPVSIASEWGTNFINFLHHNRLPVFEDIKGLRYITPILGHGGIPNYCLEDFFKFVLAPAIEMGGVTAEEILDEMSRGSGLRYQVDKPIQRFLLKGGEFVLDFFERTLEMARQAASEGIVPGGEELGLPDRITRGRHGIIRCIATSATLGRGRRDYPAVVEFARSLFDEEFEWLEDQPRRQDVIEASRYSLKEYNGVWGRPGPGFYRDLQQVLLSKRIQADEVRQAAGRWALPNDVVEDALLACQSSDCGEAVNRLLYLLLRGDGNLSAARKALLSGPRSLSDVASEVFSAGSEDADSVIYPADARESLITLVDMAVRARSDATDLPLLPARYHLFARALEGAYVCLWPKKMLFLEARKIWRESGVVAPVFELGTCKRCGHGYLIGRINSVDNKLVQCRGLESDGLTQTDYFLIRQSMADSIPDEEDEEVINQVTGTSGRYEVYELCAACGTIRLQGELVEESCCDLAGPKSKWRLLRLVTPRGKQMKCPACSSYGYDLVMRFLTGHDAPTSVLATALYQKIPPGEVGAGTDADIGGGLNGLEKVDEFLAPAISEIAASKKEHVRKMLVFSDSRQDAAFFSCYLNRTYEKIIWRRLMVKVLSKQKLVAMRLNDLARLLESEAREAGLFEHSQSILERTKEAYRWAMAELLALDRNHSLEGLGLVRFSLVRPPRWQTPPYFISKLGMSQEETWQLYEILVNSFRLQGAMAFPDEIGPGDEIFSPTGMI